MNYTHFGDAAAVAAAQKELNAANAAMVAPTCVQGAAKGLPAVVCNPKLGKAVADAAKKLTAVKGDKPKMLYFVLVAAVIVGLLWWKNR